MARGNEDSGSIDIRLGDFALGMAADLKLVVIATLVAIALVYAPIASGTALRQALGLAMVLLVPGYALIAALFPGRREIDGVERAALSFGMSVAIAALIGLGLNYTSWGIRLDPVVACLSAFTIACAAVASVRRRRTRVEDRFVIDIAGGLRRLLPSGSDAQIGRGLAAVLVLAVLLAGLALAYALAAPGQEDRYTVLYLLGPGGTADGYPSSFILGDEKPVIVGIVNHEYRSMTYELVVALDDGTASTSLYSETVTLGDGGEWEKSVALRPDRPGNGMRLEFRLYADGNKTPYRECYLPIAVHGLS